MKKILTFVTVLILIAGCQKNEMENPESSSVLNPMDCYVRLKAAKIGQTIDAGYLDKINETLKAGGVNYRVAMAELITAAGNGENGITVYSKIVGNKQLSAHFVPGDLRREWSAGNGTQITYAIDQTLDIVPPFGYATGPEATQAVVNAFNTWDAVKSTEFGLTRNSDYGMDIGIIGGSLYIFADIQMAGFRDLVFDMGILGVTYTFAFTDGGEFTDIDGNGLLDVAFREIYFAPNWYWGVKFDKPAIDIESIALHEIGHGLSQGHFGTVFTDQKDNLKASPRAVMNALYFEPLRMLQNSDIGGHSSIWGNWIF